MTIPPDPGPAERRFGIAPTTVQAQIQHPAEFAVDQPFAPLPPPTGTLPFRLGLSSVIGRVPSGGLTFHCVGDSGGIKDPHPQINVATAMIEDLQGGAAPSFLYHLGDVVYFNGDESEYGPQFYEPYAHYTRPIFAIPGNHDGDNSDDPSVASLTAFVANFCSATPHLDPRCHEYNRDTMDQPNVYWTLQAPPYLTIIGLYTNVPRRRRGRPGPNRLAGRRTQSRRPDIAGRGRAAPPAAVRGRPPRQLATDGRTARPGLHGLRPHRRPDLDRSRAQLSTVHPHHRRRAGPLHRCRRRRYHNLHKMAAGAVAGMHVTADCVLEQFCDDKWGFLRLSVDEGRIDGSYLAVAADGSTSTVDTFRLDTRTARR